MPGAFHPKLAVLVGEEDVWVAIGSGNPTTSGWGHNDAELWLVLKSNRKTGPAALSELADWLRRIHSHVKMPTWIASTVIDIADMVTPEVTDDSVPALRVLSNLDTPIIDQLPAAEVNNASVECTILRPCVSSSPRTSGTVQAEGFDRRHTTKVGQL